LAWLPDSPMPEVAFFHRSTLDKIELPFRPQRERFSLECAAARAAHDIPPRRVFSFTPSVRSAPAPEGKGRRWSFLRLLAGRASRSRSPPVSVHDSDQAAGLVGSSGRIVNLLSRKSKSDRQGRPPRAPAVQSVRVVKPAAHLPQDARQSGLKRQQRTITISGRKNHLKRGICAPNTPSPARFGRPVRKIARVAPAPDHRPRPRPNALPLRPGAGAGSISVRMGRKPDSGTHGYPASTSFIYPGLGAICRIKNSGLRRPEAALRAAALFAVISITAKPQAASRRKGKKPTTSVTGFTKAQRQGARIDAEPSSRIGWPVPPVPPRTICDDHRVANHIYPRAGDRTTRGQRPPLIDGEKFQAVHRGPTRHSRRITPPDILIRQIAGRQWRATATVKTLSACICRP